MLEKVKNGDYNYILIDVPFSYKDEYLDCPLRILASQENYQKYLKFFKQNDIIPEKYYFENTRLYLVVDVKTGEIKNYPELKMEEMINLKVRDEGIYSLLKDGQ